MAMILNVVCYNSREGKETGYVIFGGRIMKEVKSPKKPLLYYYVVILIVILLLNYFIFPALFNQSVKEVDYGTFLDMVEQGQVEEVEIQNNSIVFKSEQGEKGNLYKTGTIEDPKLVDRLHSAEVKFTKVIPKETSPLLSFILMFWILPLIIFIAIGQWMMKKMQNKVGGGNALSFGKSKAKIYVEAESGITFADVAGQDEAKEALNEIVDFLNNPKKYSAIGAKIPKGALLARTSWDRKNITC